MNNLLAGYGNDDFGWGVGIQMRLVRLSRMDRASKLSSDYYLLREYRKLRNELLNESPKYDYGDAVDEVESMASTILDHLCKIWLFFPDEGQVDYWIDEIATKYPRAPRFGNKDKVLDKASIKNSLWNSTMKSTVWGKLNHNAKAVKYKDLPRRYNYKDYVKDFVGRLDKFYDWYSGALSEAGANATNKSKLTAKVGRKAYNNMGKQERKNLQRSEASIDPTEMKEIIEKINLLTGYGDDDFE